MECSLLNACDGSGLCVLAAIDHWTQIQFRLQPEHRHTHAEIIILAESWAFVRGAFRVVNLASFPGYTADTQPMRPLTARSYGMSENRVFPRVPVVGDDRLELPTSSV